MASPVCSAISMMTAPTAKTNALESRTSTMEWIFTTSSSAAWRENRNANTILRPGVSGLIDGGVHSEEPREARERFLQFARRVEESAPPVPGVHKNAGA